MSATKQHTNTRKTVSRTTANRATANAASSTRKIPQTPERIRQMEAKALRKMRHPSRAPQSIPQTEPPFPSFVSLLPCNAHPALVKLARNADFYTGASPEARAEQEAKERAGITLKGKRLDQARRIVGDMVLAAASVHQLAGAIGEADEQEAGTLTTALECVAKVIARKGDVLDALLNNRVRGSLGNFEDEFIALTEERAAELEREEARE